MLIKKLFRLSLKSVIKVLSDSVSQLSEKVKKAIVL